MILRHLQLHAGCPDVRWPTDVATVGTCSQGPTNVTCSHPLILITPSKANSQWDQLATRTCGSELDMYE